MEDFYKNSEKRLLEQQEKIKSLENELNVYAAYNTVDKKIIPEQMCIRDRYVCLDRPHVSPLAYIPVECTVR